jgi:hypothetical protein
MQARRFGEVRRAEQLAFQVVGPAVQRAHDVALRIAATMQHQRLPVSTHIRYHLDAGRRSYQHPAVAFLWQRVVVAWVRHRQFVTEVARAGAKQGVGFTLEKRLVKITRGGQWQRIGCAARDMLIGHGPGDLLGAVKWCRPQRRNPTA